MQPQWLEGTQSRCADHGACKVLPGSGASHDSSANELAVSRAEEQGRPKHPGAEHGPCNRFTQTGLIQTFQTFILCASSSCSISHIHTGPVPCARSTPAVHGPESARAVPPLAYHAALEPLGPARHRRLHVLACPRGRRSHTATTCCCHAIPPHGAAARCRRTLPPRAAAARCHAVAARWLLPRDAASRCRPTLLPHGAATRCRCTVPPHAAAARCRHALPPHGALCRCSHTLSPGGAATRCRRTVPPHTATAATRCRHTVGGAHPAPRIVI